MALQANLTSLPSGVLQVEPAGTAYTVAQYAELMISSSDNTAADRLAALVGRGAIEAQVRRWSSHVSLDTPFLRTREFFVLKYADYPRYADAYLALSPKARDGYLGRVVDKVSLSAIHLSQAELVSPRQIDDIEWFASPSDLCRAFAGLYADAHSSSLTPIATAMSLNDGGLGLNPLTWPQVWFKGGSETGVLTLGFLARDRSGRVVVVVALLSNPRGSLDEATVATELLSIVRGSVQAGRLAGRSRPTPSARTRCEVPCRRESWVTSGPVPASARSALQRRRAAAADRRGGMSTGAPGVPLEESDSAGT